MAWLDRGLPLEDEPVAMLVSCGQQDQLEQPPLTPSPAKQEQQEQHAGEAPRPRRPPTGPGSSSETITVAANFPAMGEPLRLPPLPHGAAVAVWLSTPVGPTRVVIPAERLQESAEEGGETQLVEAVPHTKLAAAQQQQQHKAADGSHVDLLIELAFSAVRVGGADGSSASTPPGKQQLPPLEHKQQRPGVAAAGHERWAWHSVGAALAAAAACVVGLVATAGSPVLALWANAALAVLALGAAAAATWGVPAAAGRGASPAGEEEEAAQQVGAWVVGVVRACMHACVHAPACLPTRTPNHHHPACRRPERQPTTTAAEEQELSTSCAFTRQRCCGSGGRSRRPRSSACCRCPAPR